LFILIKLRPAGIKLKKLAKWQQCRFDICNNVKMFYDMKRQNNNVKMFYDMKRQNILPSDELYLATASVFK